MADHAYHDDLPSPAGVHEPLVPPDTSRMIGVSPSLQESTRDSYVGTAPTSPDPQAERPFITPGASEEKIGGGVATNRKSARRRRWPLYALAGLIAVIVIVLAVVLPVTLTKKKHHDGSGNASGASAASPTSNPESPTGAVTGGNGTVIKTEDGVVFTYTNNFGGTCA
jgi:glucan 1,3-beta-glucosidase